MEQQQLHQTQLLQNILEVLHSTDESVDLPADLGLPLKNIGEVKEIERKLEEDDSRLII